MFFLISGYVNALKPIKQIRSRQQDAALSSLASNFMRRTARLVLPTSISTVLSWALCQLGGYSLARRSGNGYLQKAPGPEDGAGKALLALVRGMVNTWAFLDNPYDRNQWAIPVLLKASYAVFLTLLAVSYTSSKNRILVVVALHIWAIVESDCTFLHLLHLSFSNRSGQGRNKVLKMLIQP